MSKITSLIQQKLQEILTKDYKSAVLNLTKPTANNLVIYFFLVLSLITSAAILRDGLIVFWDQTYPLNPKSSLENFGYTWQSYHFSGHRSTFTMNSLPYFFLIYIFSLGGLSIWLSQFILFFLTTFFALFSSYKLVELFLTEIFELHLEKRAVVIISASLGLFYTFNLFAVSNVWSTLNTNFFLFSLLPFSLFFLYKYMVNRNFSSLVLFLIISCVFLVPAFSNMAFLFAHFITTGLFTLLFLLQGNINHIKIILIRTKNLFVATFLALAGSVWWLIPAFYSLPGTYSRSKIPGAVENDIFQLSVYSRIIIQPDVKLLGGQPQFFSICETRGPGWCDNFAIYNSWIDFANIYPVVFLISLFLILFFVVKKIIYSFKSQERLKKILTQHLLSGRVWIVMVLFASFFVFHYWIIGLKDTNPFKSELLYIYREIPFIGTAFRNNYHKLGNSYLIIYTICLAFSIGMWFKAVQWLSDFLKNRQFIASKFTFLLGFLMILGVLLPVGSLYRYYFNGEIIPSAVGLTKPGARFSINEYKNLPDTFDKIKAKNIVTLPLQPSDLSYNNTETYSMGQSIVQGSTGQMVLSDFNNTPSLLQAFAAIEYVLTYYEDEDLLDLLRFLTFDTIVLQKIDSERYQYWDLLSDKHLFSYSEIRGKLDNQEGLTVVEENDKYLVYKIENHFSRFHTFKPGDVYQPDSKYYQEVLKDCKSSIDSDNLEKERACHHILVGETRYENADMLISVFDFVNNKEKYFDNLINCNYNRIFNLPLYQTTCPEETNNLNFISSYDPYWQAIGDDFQTKPLYHEFTQFESQDSSSRNFLLIDTVFIYTLVPSLVSFFFILASLFFLKSRSKKESQIS